MQFWSEKSYLIKDWILILFIFYSILLLGLKFFDPIQFRIIIISRSFKQYVQRYSIDKKFDVFRPFYLIIFFNIIISFSFIVTIYNNKIPNTLISLEQYLKTFVIIITFLILRFSLIYFLNKKLNIINNINIYFFKILIFYGLISFILMVICSCLYITNSINSIILNGIIISLITIISLFHFFIYKENIKGNYTNVLYLFYYLCAFKIAPWLWIANSL